jgi:desulfoferrodoxin (superoxide reductase-like protein)
MPQKMTRAASSASTPNSESAAVRASGDIVPMRTILDAVAGSVSPRREFLKKATLLSATSGTMMLLPACEGGGEEGEPDGSFANPWTRESPNPDATVAVEVPVVYAALVNETSVRMWVEVLDTGTNTFHPQDATHFVEQLVIEDEFANPIAALGFRYDNNARLIAQVEIPAGVETINVFSKCNLHGWWRASYSVEALRVPPEGDVRRPLTAEQPGAWADKIAVHLPVFGKRPDGKFSVEVGDRAAGKLHEMVEGHYISAVLVYDEYHQLRAGTYMNAQVNPEPVYDFDAVGGTAFVRVVVGCNLHQWWEGVFSVTGL